VKLHHKVAGAFGYELIKKSKLNDTLEEHLRNVLGLLKINCIIDVGANAGQFGSMLRDIGYHGQIFSFEPLASAFAQLEQVTSADKKWRIFQLAVGSKESEMTINRATATDFSSFRTPTAYGKKRFPNHMKPAGQEKVKMTTLASLWPDITDGIIKPRIFLKMDTQGYDLEVLKGAGATLRQVMGIQSEISLKPIYENVPDYLEVLAKLRHHGFGLTGMYLVARDKKTLEVIEYDCVMLRSQS
jgi:FkbM family methyltransferase